MIAVAAATLFVVAGLLGVFVVQAEVRGAARSIVRLRTEIAQTPRTVQLRFRVIELVTSRDDARVVALPLRPAARPPLPAAQLRAAA